MSIRKKEKLRKRKKRKKRKKTEKSQKVKTLTRKKIKHIMNNDKKSEE